MPPARTLLAELIGTFVLVFGGLAAVASAVTLGSFSGVFQVAAVWGLALTLAIYLTGAVSGAHLNPAITLAFALQGGFAKKHVPAYIAAQMLGSFTAAACVYALYAPPIAAYETSLGLTRGSAGSEATAMIFGEFTPNPGGKPLPEAAPHRWTNTHGFLAEFLGTALLALAVFGFTHKRNHGAPAERFIAPALGATLTALICLFAPTSMAGFNPARDLAPRVFSSVAGWGSLPFEVNGSAWWLVYIIAPILGAQVGAFTAKRLFT